MPSTDPKEEIDRLKAQIRDLKLALGQGNATLAVTFRLTPVLNNLAGLLLALPIVTPEMIRQRLDIAHDAKVAIHRLREHWEPWFGDDLVKSKRNVGYWIEPADKAKIKLMIAGTVEDVAAGESEISEISGIEDIKDINDINDIADIDAGLDEVA